MGTFQVNGKINSDLLYTKNHIKIGTDLETYNINRAELSIVSPGDYPGEIWLGTNGSRVWSISVRDSSDEGKISFYSGDTGHIFYINKDSSSYLSGCTFANGTMTGTASNANKLGNVAADKFFVKGNSISDMSCNDVITSRSYWSTNTATETPAQWGGLLDFDTGSHHQIFLSYSGNNSAVGLYTRAKVNGVWQPWTKFLHEANYSEYALPLSGGTMTGVLTMKGSMYTDAYTGALNMNNSNIYGLNGIYTADSADNASEGINFYRSTTTVDSLWAKSGILYFTPNRTLGENGTSYTVLHTGNYTSTLDSRYLKLSGGTMTGTITSTSSSALVQVLNDTSNWRHAITWRNTTQESGTYLSGIGRHNTGGNSSYPGCIGILPYATNTSPWDRSVGLSISKDNMFFEGKKFVDSAGKVYGAVWNDYAEFRTQNEEIEPGYCVTSSKSGKVYKTTERLQYCEGIVSDTYGFSIGETDNCKTPLAVSGRVLAYYDGDISDYEIGDTVCATVNGLITKMTREEIKEYPDRIVGTVSEIPSYDTWGSGNVPTAGRIWIKVR